ncbi:MAG TPA: hypothetical protein VOA87_21590 [Thermoanaerobaculia bacterium]|nr:hypothetical protein [Thermoanaerobaculia bacterium]
MTETMLGVVVVDLGLLTAFLGAVSLVKPLAFLGIRTRRRAALLLALGLVVVVAGASLPAREVRVAVPRTELDRFAPAYQFNEVHSLIIAAPRERVYRAIKSVSADEILFFRLLTWIRRFGHPGPESILSAPERQPLLDVATRTSFLLLAQEPNREIVVGAAVVTPPGWRPRRRATPEDFRTFRTPGFALAAMSFLVEDAGPGAAKVTTETRIYATDASARRRFAAYWRVIYPGSALIRRMWLRAIAKRALSPGA